MQDVICDAVQKNPKKDDFEIYNDIMGRKMLDVLNLKTAMKILELIKMNKIALTIDGGDDTQ
jgi:hypothetical protein